MKPWSAEIPITKSQVKEIIHSQFPDLSVKNITSLGEGWDNIVFLVNERLLFRFPKRHVAIELIEHENKLLPHLHSILKSNLQIPDIQYIGQPASLYPYPFHGYPLISGVSGCHAQLTEPERIASVIPLAQFLKELHAIDEVQAFLLGAQSQVFDRTKQEKLVIALRERVAKMQELKLFDIDTTEFEREVKAVQNITLSSEKCLIHGDVYCRHLLFQDKKLTGVIDWGDTGINHKAIDLGVIWSFYPAKCHEMFFKTYGAVDDASWQYARFIGLYSSLTLMLYGKDVEDELLVQEAVESVTRINNNIIL